MDALEEHARLSGNKGGLEQNVLREYLIASNFCWQENVSTAVCF